MARISVQAAEEGSVLTEDVTDNTGKVLLKSGTKLTKKHFQTFKIWGIRTISIASDEDQKEEIPLTPEQVARGEEYARMLLRRNEENHQLIKELHRFVSQRKARRIAEEETQNVQA